MRYLFLLVRLLCTFLGLLMLVVTFTPMLAWMVRDMAVDWYDGDADVLVVLGGSMLVDGTSPQAAMGYDSYLRCTYACWYLQHHHYKYVLVSGPDGLADAMAKYLVAHVPQTPNILTETAARTTAQNAEFTKKIIDHQPGLPPHPLIAVLTSDYHARRVQLIFRHDNFPVRLIPVPDAAKRGEFILQRWGAFLDVVTESIKHVVYKLEGKI